MVLFFQWIRRKYGFLCSTSIKSVSFDRGAQDGEMLSAFVFVYMYIAPSVNRFWLAWDVPGVAQRR